MGLPPHPSPSDPQGLQSSSDTPWVTQPSSRVCQLSWIQLSAQCQVIKLP